MIGAFFRTIWCLISPSYRAKVYRDYGWVLTFKACHCLLMKDGYDRGDMDAATILNAKMRELNAK